MLTKRGFLIVSDPLNDLGDGKTWVLECECTDKLSKDADPVDFARQCLQSDGMVTDGVSLKGRTLYVALSPPEQRTAQVGVQPAPASPESDRERLRVERLRKTYGVNLSGPPLPSYGAIVTKYVETHNGERPSIEDALGEALKSVKQSLGLRGADPTTDYEDSKNAKTTGTVPLTLEIPPREQAHKKHSSKGRPRSVLVANRQEILRRIAETGVRGERYCEQVMNKGLSTPLEWQKRDGCPKSYLEAWNFPNPQ